MKKQIFLFFFFFFVCRFTFYVDRQPTTKEDRQTFFLLLSFFRVHMRGLLPEEEVKKTNRRRCFSHEAVLTRYSQSSFELRSAFEFRFAQKWCPLFSLSRKIAAFPFVGRRMWWERKRSTHARASWKNKNMCNRTSLGDDLVVVVWINVHRGRHMWWEY